jgi:hypothetical protein
MSVPTTTDAATAMSTASSSLQSVSASSIGAGGTAAECPDLSDLETALLSITELQDDFQLILAAAANCSLLDLSGSGANSVEESLTNLQDNADGGCTSTPSCTGVACDALGLGCVEAVVQQGDTSTAGDGEISSCELVQNCLDQNSCF